MRHWLRFSVGLIVSLSLSSVAWAGMAQGSPDEAAVYPSLPIGPSAARSGGSPQPADGAAPCPLGLDFDSGPTHPLNEPVSTDPGPEVRSLPPAPNSAALMLWGLGSIGLWRVGRSARHLHLAHIPDWLHTGGPAQVGHRVAVGPDLACALVSSWPDRRPFDLRILSSLPCGRTCPVSQSIPIPLCPRGPPLA